MTMSQTRPQCFCCSCPKLAIRLLMAALCCIFPTTLKAGDTSDTLLARFKSEALQAWKEVESSDEWPGTVKVTTKIQTYTNGELMKTEEKSALIRRKPGYYLFKATKDGVELVQGQNPHYSFFITKQD